LTLKQLTANTGNGQNFNSLYFKHAMTRKFHTPIEMPTPRRVKSRGLQTPINYQLTSYQLPCVP
jgi:hypothetical protein